MALHIGEEAPNFTARRQKEPSISTTGLANGWAILFSHPKISPRFAQPSSATWRV